MTAISQERLRSDRLAIMQDGRERTIGDLVRRVDAAPGDIGQAMLSLILKGKMSMDSRQGIGIYRIQTKDRKAA